MQLQAARSERRVQTARQRKPAASRLVPAESLDPTITEGEEEQEREAFYFRVETERELTWEPEHGRVVLFYEDGWHLMFAHRD